MLQTSDDFAQLALPQTVYVDGERYRVPSPTIRQVLEVRASLDALVSGDDDEAQDLIEILDDWLPGPFVRALEDRPIAELDQILAQLLMAAVPAPPAWLLEEIEDADEDETRPPARPDFETMLADYVQIYGGEVWEVYNRVPWAFFLAFMYRRRTAIARQLLRWSEVFVLPHTGKGAGGMVADLERRANQRPRRSADAPLYAPPEQIKKDRAELRKMFGPNSARNEEA